MKIPLVAVVGPTASGKSRLAVELALNWNGEVISADSMQIYRGMDIGTAKPAPEEMRGVRHHMIGFADPSRPFSVADYVRLAGQCIAGIDERGKLPILAGGTGLYVRSLLKNTRFAEAERDEA
ncbi:MAG TPA: tRNA (adenosine(37)-N6)-dimethylallyltransferase MiaA, partial [Ruminococcaceae bacterium]|nr:tRNA (adenosine(37)-N6)-dimethylallyltransferase MiaA [Oscillospiraceae bacterium]